MHSNLIATSSPVEIVVPGREKETKHFIYGRPSWVSLLCDGLTEVNVAKGARADLPTQAIFVAYPKLHPVALLTFPTALLTRCKCGHVSMTLH